LAGLQAVVALAGHAVIEVAQGRGVAVAVVAARQVVSAGGSLAAGGNERPDESEGGKPVVLHVPVGDADAAPRSFVTGADPAKAFNARASTNRVRSSPISASSRAPVRAASPTNEVMIA
jgi:hypothetical protein